MKNKIKILSKNKFIRNVIILASGTAGAQAITMLFSPFITRMYGPEAFGIMGTFTAITRVVIPVAALTYPIAIVLPKNDQDAKGLVRLSLIITFITSIISLILLLLFNKKIITFFNINEIGDFLFLIPLVLLFAGLMQVSEQWLIRTKQFSINAKVTLYQSIIINISKVSIGAFYPIAKVLVFLTAASNGIKAILLLMFAKKSKYQSVNNQTEKKRSIKKLAKDYYDFPAYRAPEEFLNATSNGLPILMLTTLFGPASAGFYALVLSVLSLPSQLIGKSVGDVFYPRIAEAANNKENMTALIKKATYYLALVGIVPFGLVFLFGPFLFSFIFGAEWVTAGEYARWISIWLFFAFINRPSVKALPVLNAQRFQLIYTTIMLVTRITALGVSYYLFVDDVISIAAFGIAGAILNIGLISITLRLSKLKAK